MLVEELSSELKQPRPAGQPLILEEQLEHTNAIQVHVVWDELAECSEEERTRVIFDAFERVHGPESRDRVILAVGLTVPEAGDLGLLPVRVVRVPTMGTAADQEIAAALREEGASWLRPPLAPELRFRDERDAIAAIGRLETKLPGCRFILVHDARP
jgi:hypothetical protein